MPGGLKKKSLRTELDLTPKQKMFVEIYVKDWGSITQAEAANPISYDAVVVCYGLFDATPGGGVEVFVALNADA